MAVDIHLKKNKLGNRTIKQLLNSVIANIVISQCLTDRPSASANNITEKS